MVDAFAGGYTMCRSGRHWMNRHYTKIAFEETVHDGSCEKLSYNLPLGDLYGLSKGLVRQFSKGLNVRGSRMRFQMTFTFPVFIKYEESRIGLRLVQIVVNAAGLRTSGSQQALQNLANARFLPGLCADVRNDSKRVVHTPPMTDEF